MRDDVVMADHEPVRLAEVLGVLSRATDLAMGLPFDSARPSCVLAVRLAEAAGFPESAVRDVYDYAHLRYVGCNADTDVLASPFGDEIDLRRDFAYVDQGRPTGVAAAIVRAARRSTADEGPVATLRAVSRGLMGGGAARESFLGHCEVGQRLATRLGFGGAVVEGFGQLYGRWDGKGVPGVAGDEVSPIAMCVTLAQDAVNYSRLGGPSAATAVVSRRAGRVYRPDLAETFLKQSSALLADLVEPPSWQGMLDLEPGGAHVDRREDDRAGRLGARHRHGRGEREHLGPSGGPQREPVGAGSPACLPGRACPRLLRAFLGRRRYRRLSS